MNFEQSRACWLVLLFAVCYGMPITSLALCEELSMIQTGSEDRFFLNCTNSYSKPAYTVTEYYAGSKRNGFVAYKDGSKGFMCASLENGSDCQSMPKGPLDFRTFIMKPGLVGVIEQIEKAPKYFGDKEASHAYPKTLRSAQELGCFLRMYGTRKVVFGLDADRLHTASACFVAFERYLAQDKTRLLK